MYMFIYNRPVNPKIPETENLVTPVMEREISFDMEFKEALRNSVLNSTLPNSLLGGQPVREVIQKGHFTPLSVCSYEYIYCRTEIKRGDWEAFEDVMAREFPPGSVGRRVLFQGGVGMGKTTVLEKVIWDWTTGTRLQHYAFLLRVPVLEMAALGEKTESLQSVLSRIYTQIPAETLAVALQRPQSLLLVLDGLEKNLLCSASSSSSLISDMQQEAAGSVLLSSLLHGSLLPEASMLIMSREPVDIESFHFFEVVGFSKTQERTFFQEFFGDIGLSERLFQQSKQALGVYDQCFCPAFCWTLCNVIKIQIEGKTTPPETLTQLLGIITCMLMQKQKMHAEETRELVLGLGKLTNRVSSYNDITSCGLRSFLHQPVLSAFLGIRGDVTSPDTTFSFLSPMMQEFLLATSFYLDQSVKISDERSNLYYIFLAGLSDSAQRKPIEDLVGSFDESRISEFSQWLKGYVSNVLAGGDAKKHFRVFHLLQHARNSSLVVESVCMSQWSRVCYSEMEEAECAALSYVVSCLGEMDHLGLFCAKLTDEKVEKLIPALRLSKSIDLHQGQLSFAAVTHLAAELAKGRMTILNFSYPTVEKDSVKTLIHSLTHSALQSFILRECFLTTADCDALAKMLSRGSHRHVPSLFWNKREDQDLHLSNALENRLQEIKVSDCELTGSCCSPLTAAIQSEYCSLTELDLTHNDLGQSRVMQIFEALLAPNCTLQTLHLCVCKLTEEDFRALGSVLSSGLSSLISLSVGGNAVGDAGAKHMWEAMRHKNFKLQYLDLEMMSLTDACVEELCESVAASSTLSTLILKVNDMTDTAIPPLVNLMLGRPLMEQLNLKYNDFTEDFFELMDTVPNIVY